MEKEIKIRMATAEDAKALLAIYTPYVEKTAITFEYEVPSIEEFTLRIKRTLERYPYLVAEKEGCILGYAYASAFKERAAYAWSVETSIYIREDARGSGIGKGLYEHLETYLKKQKVINSNACIAYPSPSSIAFHEKMGYQKVAHFSQCGYKNGQWWDMVWMEKMLGPHPEKPDSVQPIGAIL